MKRDCQCPRARHEHGTPAGYAVCGCTCFPCRVAYAEQCRDRRAGRRTGAERTWPFVPAIGTRRRLQALHAIGWSGKEIADRLGVTLQYVHRLRTDSQRIMPSTAARVSELYDELWDQAPPTDTRGQKQAASYARTTAKKHGWLPPMSYDDDKIDAADYNSDAGPRTPRDIDEVAVERACLGDSIPLTKAELSEAVDTLTRMGYGAEETARRLRISDRTVVRHRRKDVA